MPFLKTVGCGCPGCGADECTSPSVPTPTLKCDSISASKTKCGWDEYAGHVSTPPKKYLTKTFGGASLEARQYAGADCSPYDGCSDRVNYLYSGANTYNRVSCDYTQGGTIRIQTFSPCNVAQSETTSGTDNADDFSADGCTTNSFTSTTWQQTSNGCYSSTAPSKSCRDNNSIGGVAVSETLSDEYTTTLLISDVVAALPSYPGTWSGTCSSLRDLSSDELTYSIRRFKYKFQLPDLTGYSCYQISWMEGGTSRSYTWDGVATETPVYGPVSEPGSNGTVGISSIVASCC